MDDESFFKLLEYFNRSRSGYRKVRKGVKKRIVRHMQSAGVSNIEAYLALLDRDDWFEKVPGKKQFRVKESIRSGIVFQRRDFILEPPPANRLHLVFARNNLLTYFRAPEKDAAFEQIQEALAAGGVLVVGSHEKVPEGSSSMKRMVENEPIYMRD